MSCVDDLFEKLKAKDLEGLTRSDLKKFEEKLRQERIGRDADSVIDRANELGDEEVILAFREKRQAALNRRAQVRAIQFVQKTFPDDLALGMEAIQVGVNIARKRSKMSADAAARRLFRKYARGVETDLRKADVFEEFRKNVYDREEADALYRLGKGLDTSDIPEPAVKIARVMKKYEDLSRADANAAGAWIANLPGYIISQSHDMFRIRRVDFKTWRDVILPKLDQELTFKEFAHLRLEDAKAYGVQVEKFLNDTYIALSSGVHLSGAGMDSVELPRGVRGIGGDVASRMSASRVLHFTDGLAWFDYNSQFGINNMNQAFLFGLRRMGQNTGLMQVFGPNANANRSAIMATLLRTKDAKQRGRLDTAKKKLMNQWHEITGATNVPQNHVGAMVGGFIRNLEVMSKLGFATISAFGDTLFKADTYMFNGIGFFDSYGLALSEGVGRARTGKLSQQIASGYGVAADSFIGSAVHRFSGIDDIPGGMAEAVQTFMKFSLMNWWTDSGRRSAAHTFSHWLGQNAGDGWGNLNPRLKRNLEGYGFDGNMWDAVRKGAGELEDGRIYITPEGVDELPDSAFTAMVNERMKGAGKLNEKQKASRRKRLLEEVRNDADEALNTYVIDQIDSAILVPDARTRAFINAGTQRGTFDGEMRRFFFQFKSFSLSMTQRVLGRTLFGQSDQLLKGNMLTQTARALVNGKAEFLGMIHLMGASAVFGYIAMSAKDMLKGRTPRTPQNIEEAQNIFKSSILQGGGMGIYGDFLFGAVDRHGQGFLETFGGPAFADFNQVRKMTVAAARGEPDAQRALSFVLNRVPNLFYTRLATDMLFFHWIRETMNPGYLRRMEQRIESDNDQQFFIKPSETVPRGGLQSLPI